MRCSIQTSTLCIYGGESIGVGKIADRKRKAKRCPEEQALSLVKD